MAEHNKLGNKGEELACEYLLSKSYKILDKQWRFKHKEIDIVALDEDVLVFVEVKTRTNNYWGNPEEFVTKTKQKYLISAADNYIVEKDFDLEARFDIISIVYNNEEPQIEHIIEAFYP
ncbi:MAG: YraN family protein [Marinilabiliales bacterium]|nr:MAG: YraN family protein [Marinilabiliales bacterium]